VNGGGDVLFNDDPSPRGIGAIAAAHRRFGTTALLPTLLSDTPEKMRAARDAVEAAAGVDPSVIGLHYEGPFLSPDKAGVHDRSMLRRPEPGDFELLAPLRSGVILVTLAPEQVPLGFIARLAGAGVRVSLGHSMATYAQTRAALSEGLTGFTHLFNAMRPLASREPGPIAAALEEPGARFGIIVDGEHVSPAMLRSPRSRRRRSRTSNSRRRRSAVSPRSSAPRCPMSRSRHCRGSCSGTGTSRSTVSGAMCRAAAIRWSPRRI
jgi:N-acetylglucosamine-6-phosphate deacetylase